MANLGSRPHLRRCLPRRRPGSGSVIGLGSMPERAGRPSGKGRALRVVFAPFPDRSQPAWGDAQERSQPIPERSESSKVILGRSARTGVPGNVTSVRPCRVQSMPWTPFGDLPAPLRSRSRGMESPPGAERWIPIMAAHIGKPMRTAGRRSGSLVAGGSTRIRLRLSPRIRTCGSPSAPRPDSFRSYRAACRPDAGSAA